MVSGIVAGLSRFVSLAGIGGISQTVANELVAQLADPDLSERDFQRLVKKAESMGYVLEQK